MSGYRSLHREQVLPGDKTAIWSCRATTTTSSTNKSCGWRIWTANSDGLVRVYKATEATLDDRSSSETALNASALNLQCTHVLTGPTMTTAAVSAPSLGCTVVDTARNYVGDDDSAGDLIVLSLDLGGRVRVWKFLADWDSHYEQQQSTTSSDDNDENSSSPKPIPCWTEFTVDLATGTTAAIAPPRVIMAQGVVVTAAVGCLDGTVAIVSTGIATPNATISTVNNNKEPSQPAAGTVLDTWGSIGSATPLSLAWHPVQMETLVVGRQDGVVDVLSSSKKQQHRLTHLSLHHGSCPVRAVSFTPDGHLLIAGNDAGMLCVWDTSRAADVVLVHHVLQAHKSWILNVACLSDSRRFVTVGAERQIHVWSVGQLAQNQPLHTFQLDHSVWAVDPLQQPGRSSSKDHAAPRLVTGSDNGWIQVFSLES